MVRSRNRRGKEEGNEKGKDKKRVAEALTEFEGEKMIVIQNSFSSLYFYQDVRNGNPQIIVFKMVTVKCLKQMMAVNVIVSNPDFSLKP